MRKLEINIGLKYSKIPIITVLFSTRDSNKFTVSVNVESESKVTFNLTYEQLLTRKLGVYENVVNLQPGQVNTKYNTITLIIKL